MSEPPCTCPGPGFCERYGIEQGEYAHGVCSGNGSPGRPCSAYTSQRYRDAWARRKGVPLPVVTPAVQVDNSSLKPPKKVKNVHLSRGPCRFRGDELTGPERAAAKLGHTRRWFRCSHADRPLGEYVCACRGCGTGCRGYDPEPEPTSPAGSEPTP